MKHEEQDRCIGCGKCGALVCANCRAFLDAAHKKMAKMWHTIEFRFAMSRFQ